MTGEVWKNEHPFRLALNKAPSEVSESGAALAPDMEVPVSKMEDSFEAHYQASLKTAKDPDGGPFPAYPSGKSWDEASGMTRSGKKFYHNVISGAELAALLHGRFLKVMRFSSFGSHTARSSHEPHTPGGTMVDVGVAVSPENRSPFSDVFLIFIFFEITEMCKNVDDCIESDCGDKGLCKDLCNPVGVTVCRGAKRS